MRVVIENGDTRRLTWERWTGWPLTVLAIGFLIAYAWPILDPGMSDDARRACDLIQLGAYAPGHDAELDQAVRLQPQLTALLQQDMHDRAPLEASLRQLSGLIGG